MRQKRCSVFETNSSSCHSLSFDGANKQDNSLKAFIDYDNYLHVNFGEFGWEEEVYSNAYKKLSYLLTFIAEKFSYEEMDIWCCDHPMPMDEIYDKFKTREDFNELNSLIKDKLDCNGIWLDEGEGYIDHQSHEDYDDVYGLLNDWNIPSMEDFIFNTGYFVRTANDNG